MYHTQHVERAHTSAVGRSSPCGQGVECAYRLEACRVGGGLLEA
jgi:hypothetical protein